ncbi:MAG: PEGA domain-containing protein [Methanospirillum sp.]
MPSQYLRHLCLVLLLIAIVLPVAGANIAAGSITVRSVPGGASATLDGVYQGKTPLGNEALLIENIDPGPHQLVLSKSGYLDDQHPFWIGSAQRSDIRITLSATTSQTGSVSIVSSPSGADLLIDGGYRGRTPITISGLSTGLHTVVLELPGYIRYGDTVDVQNGVMTYLDPVLTATAAVGFISVASSPSGAFVYVDGVYRGVTPLTVAATTGSRQIELDHSGYADWTTTTQVTNGVTVPVNAYLQLLPASSNGGIAVSSDPAGAGVYLDDQYRGVTTSYGDLELTGVAAGSHTLSGRLDGYDEYRLTVQVTPDATVQVRPRLTAAGNPSVSATPTVLVVRGSIQANSTPSGAKVAIDGSFKGTTPLSIADVPAGMHTVRFSLDGYVEREQQVDIQAGQTATLSANLTPVTTTRSGVPVLVVFAALVAVAVAAFLRSDRQG